MKLQLLSFTASIDIHCHVILRKPKEASFHAKSQNQAMTHASNTLCLLVFLSLSIIIRFKHVPKIFLNTSVTHWRFRMEQDNWTMRECHLRTLLTYHLTADVYFAPLPLYLGQTSFDMETHHFRPLPVVHGPNPDYGCYLRYTLSYQRPISIDSAYPI